MSRVSVAIVAMVAFAGCAAPPVQEDRTTFTSEGSFAAALEAGGHILAASDDPGDASGFPEIPLDSSELNAAWGRDRYALQSIHWWGPTGAPDLGGEGVGMVEVSAGGTWQGFLVGPDQLQVIPGGVPSQTVQTLADHFLENITDLDASGRAEIVTDLMANCDALACHTDQVAHVDGEVAWRKAGGLAAVTEERMAPGEGMLAIDDWWFSFAFDRATLEDASGEGRTFVHVGSNDVVEFRWHSWGEHSDAESYARMADVLDEHEIGYPPASGLEWSHDLAETD